MKFFQKASKQAESEGRPDGAAAGAAIADFVRDAVEGGARCRIRIAEIPDLCTALMSGLEAQGTLDQQQLEARLHGECPKCGIRLKGAGLVMVTTASRFGTVAFSGGSAATERVVRGRCASESCDSKEIVVAWDG